MNDLFISVEDLAIAHEYSEAGYIIRPNSASDAFLWIQKQTALIAANALKLEEPKQVEKFLDEWKNIIHRDINCSFIHGIKLLKFTLQRQ